MSEHATDILTSLAICRKLNTVPFQGCGWCHAITTPLWRKDKQTLSIILCNKCGLRSNKGQRQWHSILYAIKKQDI